MDLIIGGAFQGKLDYAKEKFGFKQEDVFECREDSAEINFLKPCINHLEEFTLACVRQGVDPVAYFDRHFEDARDGCFITMDISCGVVPLGKEMRLWRNEHGRLCQYLSRQSRSVIRIFCGLEQVLK